MKLLDWMHRKFRQNSGEPLKDFLIGHDQRYYQKTRIGSKAFKQDKLFGKSFSGLEAEAVEEDDYEQEMADEMSELFQGFLTIGTLGSEPASINPTTQTFTYSVEYITEKEIEVTENELKLINYELEKVLVDEAKKERGNDSSVRSSDISTGTNSSQRSSHGNTITVGVKPIYGQETNGNIGAVCPLQEYLLGSAVELSEPQKTAKKEHRTSLGELFQRTKMEEDYGEKVGDGHKQTDKDWEKSTMYLIKKFKKKVLPATSKSSKGCRESSSAEKKLQKILQIFQRKVHPEYSTGGKKARKQQAEKATKRTAGNGHETHDNGNHDLLDEKIVSYPEKTYTRKSSGRLKSQLNLPHRMREQVALETICPTENSPKLLMA